MNRNQMVGSKGISSFFAVLAIVVMLITGVSRAEGQACASQNWTATTPNVWAADGSIKVMLNNNATTNQPTIPTYNDDGNFSPFGFEEHPQSITVLNDVYSCPSGTPVITIAGAGRETVSFQIFVSASAALSHVSVAISPLTGAGTLTSDNTGTSNVTRYLEGYVPYSGVDATQPAQLQANGQMPDPLIPFYDPYDSGNPAVGTPFNVQAGTTQGVWVNVSIPANQTAGAYTGTITISGTGITTTTIPIKMTVWNGNLPAFDAGSTNSAYADMLKSWLPLYRGNFDSGEAMTCGGPGCATELSLYEKYQIMGHNYYMDVQMDADSPTINGCYPTTGGCTSFTTNGTTSSLDWTNYDAYEGPALTPGGLFADGTAMRVFDTPLSSAGSGAWPGGTGNYGYTWYDNEADGYSGSLVPSGLTQLYGNLATQTSQHFAANHTSKSWVIPELIAYDYDETANDGKGKLGYDPQVYQNISRFNAAVNNSNTALSSTWAASTAPIHTFLTDMPACEEAPDDTDNNGVVWYGNPQCADHINLSYPGGTNATAGYSNSWEVVWSPNPVIFMPGRPGPAFHSDTTPTLVDGTGYQYTFDLTDGVPVLSTAPAPIERWFYQGGDPASLGDALSNTGVGWRANYWIAYKYSLDVTVGSSGVPTPAAPAPGGVWDWVGNFWGGYNGPASPGNCASSSTPSPFVSAATNGDGVLFYPGNEVGCYYTANPVGEAALTASPVVNTSCSSNGYSLCDGISGPVASMRLETVRRGYEDYEYMYLLGKQSGRAAPLAIINAMGGAGMTAGGQGTTSWNALDWENVTGTWYEMGVEPESAAYTGNCTDSTPGIGGLPNGLPNGPTGAASSYLGEPNHYYNCPGEWTNNPYRYEEARVQMAQQLGFAPASTIPSVTSLSATSGSNTGGTSITITGTNFTGVNAVEFGGVAATSYTVNSVTSITAITPAGTGTVDVQVFNASGVSQYNSADLYTYVSPVTVTGLSPTQGVAAGGNSVTITGTDFSTGATVMFGSTAATGVVVNSSTSITAVAPAGSGTVNVTVTTYQGTSAINSSDLYTYEPPPTVTGVSPATGSVTGGTSVTLTGAGFASGMTVKFGSTAATSVTVSSSTSATATSPSNSSPDGGVVIVSATTVDGTSPINPGSGNSDTFTYTSPVTITGLNVHTGAPGGGTSVVITGTDFTGASAVKFGSDTATFTVNSATQITAISPAGGGTVDVTVTNGSYASAPVSADQFSYTAAVANGTFATLPTTAVGSSSTATTVSVTLAAATAISSITVPTAQNGVQEFVVGTVTGCTIGTTVNAAGTVCHIPITFKPQYPGIRSAPVMLNNNGDVVGVAGLTGIGQGPEIGVSPGSLYIAIGGGANGVTATPQSVSTAAIAVSNNGSGLAMDGEGNLYIADNQNCLVYKENPQTNQIVVVAGNYANPGGNGPTPTTTPSPALGSGTCPQGIAVDGAGNIYLVDAHTNDGSYPNTVEMVSATTGEIAIIAGGGSVTPTTTAESALSAKFNAVNSLATDTAGNVYISDFYNNQIEKLTPAGQIVVVVGSGGNSVTTTAQSATSVALQGPTGMIFDASGNLYLSDQNISQIDKVNTSGQITLVAGGGSNAPTTTPQAALTVGLNASAELAVDGAGDLYIGDVSSQIVEELNLAGQLMIVAGNGGTAPSTTPVYSTNAALGPVQGIAVDGVGNLYIADGTNIGNGDNMIEKVAVSGATLSFAYTNVGSTSASQAFTLANIGNETLTLSSVTTPTDYVRETGGTCATGTVTLTTSTNCSIDFAFQPTTGGVLSESATVTDNNLNGSSVTQPLHFTGTGIGGTTVATPAFSPVAGAYVSSQTVTISSSTSGATIYYTTNGTTPTTSSTVYSAPITVSTSETVEALAVKSGDTNSAVGSAAYIINATVATPTFSPAAGSYGPAQTVTISSSTSGATIYYTTNGTTPTTSSTVYSSPITVSANETVEALAVKSGYNNSTVGSAAYVINGTVATPTFSPAAGSYGPAQTVTISSSTSGTTIYYTTNGTTPTTSSTVYSSAITVSASETVKALAVKTGYTNSAVGSAAYVINGTVATPTFSPVAGTYATSQTVTITSATSGATIYYTTNGTTPTTSSTVYSSAITVAASETVEALAVKSGYTNSAVGSAAYVISGTVATPTFSPAAGSYGPAQTVTITSATSGATIYYTTNGTTPTTSSTVYSSAITVSASETVKALAAKSGYTNSAVGSAAYVINGTVATPAFSPAAGSYGPAQTVTITSATAGTTIYYTTNGTTPTTSSTVYSSAITVSASETVKALAVKSGYTNSAIGSAAYVINGTVATPTFSPAAGSYTSAQSVAITSATAGTTIYYTTNGTTPTTSSTLYSSAISVAATETVKALAVKTGYTNSAIGSAAYTITLPPDITTLAGVQGSTTAPASGMVAHGNSIGAPVGLAVAPIIGGAGGDIYFDICSTAWNCSYNYNLYVLYKGGAAAKAILVASGVTSPVIGDTYPVPSPNETGPASLSGLFVDSYGNLLVADWSYSRVYMFYAGTVTGQGTNPADALLLADGAAYESSYGLHAGYAYHIADGSNTVGSAPTNIGPRGVWVDSAENVFFADYNSNAIEVVYNATGTSAGTILTAEGYTSLQQGKTYIIAGGQSVTTYPNDNDSGTSVAFNGGTSTANSAVNGPFGIYGDSSGNLYFTDYTSNKIKKLTASTAVLSTIGGPAAGTATTVGHSGDGGLATAAQMNGPIGIVVGSTGAVYFADSANAAVRTISTTGYISTVAGTSGTSGTYSGEGGAATSATMSTLYHLALDASGNIYVADEGDDLIHVF